jgi:hypothetical protein
MPFPVYESITNIFMGSLPLRRVSLFLFGQELPSPLAKNTMDLRASTVAALKPQI